MDRRFVALRVFGTMLKVLAWIELILGFLASVLMLVLGFVVGTPLGIFQDESGSQLVGVLLFLLILIVAVVLFLGLYAAGELTYAVISVEENTRRTAYILQQQYAPLQASYPSQPEYEDEASR